MRIYKVVYEKTPESKPVGYGGRRTVYHERRYAESKAEYERKYNGWNTRVIQSTEFEWEE